MKKYVCEFLGTFILVLLGCGSAVLAGGYIGVVGVALAFGLSIVAIAYSVGRISGGHVNPAVSLAMLINGKISVKDFCGYVVAQIAGAFAGSGILALIVSMTELRNAGLGANGFGDASAVGLTMVGALIVEIIATCIFVLAILGVTHNDKLSSKAGIVIGLVLALVHLVCIPLTGTSVNPARSLAPAVILGGEALSQVWVFIVGPLVGAVIAGLLWKFLAKNEEEI
jgi:aquaporin Z